MIHGWIYRLSDGKLRDLGVSVKGDSDVESAYTEALKRLH
jgi:carbonic anhydrase